MTPWEASLERELSLGKDMTVDNQHQKIKGYRELSQAEIDLMNEGKALAEQVGAYIEKLRVHGETGRTVAYGKPELDQRWISLGATQLQQGFMAVIRGIAQPTTF